MTVSEVHELQTRQERGGEPEARITDADERDSRFLRHEKPPPLVEEPDITIVDLFAGCGGLTIGALEGARRAGLGARLAMAIDDDLAPLAVLRETLSDGRATFSTANLGAVLAPFAKPLEKAERTLFSGVAEPSLMLAGPPCQGHSTLNNHTRYDDPRNDLYLSIARAARLLQPKAIIVENVRGVGADRRTAVNRCIAALEELGYEVVGRTLDLHTIGVPQRRTRHVLMASLGDPFEWNLKQAFGRTVGWAIGDLTDVDDPTLFDTPSQPTTTNRERIDWLFEQDEYNLPNHLRPRCHRSDHSYRSMYGRLRWDAPAQTITSGFGSMGQGRYVHPLVRRTLTPHEAARLQFLPDFIRFSAVELRRTALATMIGNVAPPLLATVLVEALIEQQLL